MGQGDQYCGGGCQAEGPETVWPAHERLQPTAAPSPGSHVPGREQAREGHGERQLDRREEAPAHVSQDLVTVTMVTAVMIAR